MKSKVTVLANMYIGNVVRLEHLKNSFQSFCDISDNWLINIRGPLRRETIAFLKRKLGGKMQLFQLLDDQRGWLINASDMLSKAKYDYVLVWNEDHLNIASQSFLENTIEEISKESVDYMLYTHFSHWRQRFDAASGKNIYLEGENIDFVDLTKNNIKQFFPIPERVCLISSTGIFKKEFLQKILDRESKKFPFVITKTIYFGLSALQTLGLSINIRLTLDQINKIFFFKLPRFPLETPFELEILQDKTYVLPLRIACSKKELFVCIDDDIDTGGYQLIKRGLYPDDIPTVKSLLMGKDEVIEQNEAYTIRKINLVKGETYKTRYYENNTRTMVLLKNTIVLLEGKISVNTRNKSSIVFAGQSINLYPNLGYNVRAEEKSTIVLIFPSLHNKNIKYV